MNPFTPSGKRKVARSASSIQPRQISSRRILWSPPTWAPKPKPKSKASSRLRTPPTGDDIRSDLWAKLLGPLPLMSCLKLETVCRRFQRTIFSGQTRFVWNKKFKEHLLHFWNITLPEKKAESFLALVASRIGPYVRHVTLKAYTLPSNYQTIFANLPYLQSLYLKLGQKSNALARFITIDSVTLLPAEFRLVSNDLGIITEVGGGRSGISFEATFKANASKLVSLQLWQLETKNSLQAQALTKPLPALKKYRLFINEETIAHYLLPFMEVNGARLEKLYIKCVLRSIHPTIVRDLGAALSKCTRLSTLSLQLDWGTIYFAKAYELLNFDDQWSKLCTAQLSPHLAKLSIDVENTNFRTKKNSSDLIADLVARRKLKMLRINASMIEVFPLRLPAASLETVELSLLLQKMYCPVGELLIYYSLLPPCTVHDAPFLFAPEGSPRETVKCLKLTLFPLFDDFLARHLFWTFPKLELFSFSAFHQAGYHEEGGSYYGWGKDKITFTDGLKTFLRKEVHCRVLRLADKFEKPDLSFLVVGFYGRARKNPKKMYALYLDWKKCFKTEKELAILQKCMNLKNFRVY